jgi:hypothetical protein
MEAVRVAYEILVGKPGGMSPFGRHRHMWEDDIGMDLRRNRVGNR